MNQSRDELRAWLEQAACADLAVQDEVSRIEFPEVMGKPAEKRCMEPLLLVQETYGLMGPTPPIEVFTDEDSPLSATIDYDNDPIPIDRLLGVYLPLDRKIVVYVKEICRAAQYLGISAGDLEFKVRQHEYGHALVHLGIEPWSSKHLAKPNHVLDEPGDWEPFIAARNKLFIEQIDSDTHELMAQSVSWTLLNEDRREAFVTLMDRQPDCYKLSGAYRNQISPAAIRLVAGLLQRGMLRADTHFAQRLRACVEKGVVAYMSNAH